MESIQFVADLIKDGGVLAYVVTLVFILGMAVSFERIFRIKAYSVKSSSFINEIQKLVLASKIKDAIQYCSGTGALLPMIVKNALKRSNQGIEQIQNAIDASALEAVPLVEQRTHWVPLCANVATLLGLLGTIVGLIESFQSVKVSDPAMKEQILSGGIALAMNTTALGLAYAVTLMVMHAFVVSLSDKLLSDIDQYSVKILDLLGTVKAGQKFSTEE
jgi:biopolymer transport protein ExbB/TolQ